MAGPHGARKADFGPRGRKETWAGPRRGREGRDGGRQEEDFVLRPKVEKGDFELDSAQIEGEDYF